MLLALPRNQVARYTDSHGYLPQNLNSVLTFPAFANPRMSVVVIKVVVTDVVVAAQL